MPPNVVESIIYEVTEELSFARGKFPPMRSFHEGLAIIEEELFELRMEVYKQHDVREREKLRHEAMQVAAMAIRFMLDLT